MKATVALALAALACAIGVPTALADTSPDWFERAAANAVRTSETAPYRDAFERVGTAGIPLTTGYVDAFERSDVPSTQATPVVKESETTIAWSQVAIAFGFGLVLALGLAAAMRMKSTRPLAQ